MSDDGDALPQPTFDWGVGRTLRYLEATIGCVFAGIIAMIGLVTGCVFLTINTRSNAALGFATAGLVAIVLIDLRLLRPLWRARDAYPLPMAVEAVLAGQAYPWLLRPVMAAWWFAHFLAGLFGAFGVEYSQSQLPQLGGPQVLPVDLILTMAAVFGISFAGNLFLVLAFGAVSRNETLLNRIWRLRLLWDSLITMTAGVLLIVGKH